MSILDIDTDYAFKTALRVDALYYHLAKKNYGIATKAEKAIDKAQKYYETLRNKEHVILKKHEWDVHCSGNELEPIYIQLEGAEDDLGKSYGPFLQSLAATHILSAASLETHINIQAKSLLTAKVLDLFEPFSLEAKWLFLSKLIDGIGFNPGKEPFQSFSALVKFRNKLVHYKDQTEEWVSPGVPTFLEKIGLTLEAGRRSIKCVEEMIVALSKQLKAEIPSWIKSESINYFDFRLAKLEKK